MCQMQYLTLIQSNSNPVNLKCKISHLITHCYDRQVGYLLVITMGFLDLVFQGWLYIHCICTVAPGYNKLIYNENKIITRWWQPMWQPCFHCKQVCYNQVQLYNIMNLSSIKVVCVASPLDQMIVYTHHLLYQHSRY